jgi:hypothetical protein
VFVGRKFCGKFCSWEKERKYSISDSSFYEGKTLKKLSFFFGENVDTFGLSFYFWNRLSPLLYCLHSFLEISCQLTLNISWDTCCLLLHKSISKHPHSNIQHFKIWLFNFNVTITDLLFILHTPSESWSNHRLIIT